MKSSKLGYLKVGFDFRVIVEVVKRRKMGLADIMREY